MTRPCPVCTATTFTTLFAYRLTHGGEQSILCCSFCGMVFSTVTHAADYANESIYSLPNALGSGGSPFDRHRLEGLVDKLVNDFRLSLTTSILDIGCAQGGLLSSLRDRGFTSLYGMDPSPFCVEMTSRKGFMTTLGHLGEPCPKTDLTILSHVIEHVENPREALRSLQSPMVYVEVPNAARYKDYPNPFLDFNSEHINHFSLSHLLDLLEYSGYLPIHAGEREITLTNGSPYPAIYALATRNQHLRKSIDTFIAHSDQFLLDANARLEKKLGDSKECIFWGAGEYMTFIAHLPVFMRVRPVQALDRNPSLHGREACGLVVDPPSKCLPSLPIVITTIVAIDAITRDARAMGLKNKIVSVI